MSVHAWQNYNYLFDKSTFKEFQEWMGYFWKHIKYYTTSTLNVSSSNFITKPYYSYVFGDSLSDNISNLTQITQLIRYIIAETDTLDFDRDLINQQIYYDAALTYQRPLLNIENYLLTRMIVYIKPVLTEIDNFFISTTSYKLNKYFDMQINQNRMTASHITEWNDEFIEMWKAVKNENLSGVIKIYQKESGSWIEKTEYISIIPDSGTKIELRSIKTNSTINISSITFINNLNRNSTKNYAGSSLITITTASEENPFELILENGTSSYKNIATISIDGGSDGDIVYFVNKPS